MPVIKSFNLLDHTLDSLKIQLRHSVEQLDSAIYELNTVRMNRVIGISKRIKSYKSLYEEISELKIEIRSLKRAIESKISMRKAMELL